MQKCEWQVPTHNMQARYWHTESNACLSHRQLAACWYQACPSKTSAGMRSLSRQTCPAGCTCTAIGCLLGSAPRLLRPGQVQPYTARLLMGSQLRFCVAGGCSLHSCLACCRCVSSASACPFGCLLDASWQHTCIQAGKQCGLLKVLSLFQVLCWPLGHRRTQVLTVGLHSSCIILTFRNV